MTKKAYPKINNPEEEQELQEYLSNLKQKDIPISVDRARYFEEEDEFFKKKLEELAFQEIQDEMDDFIKYKGYVEESEKETVKPGKRKR